MYRRERNTGVKGENEVEGEREWGREREREMVMLGKKKR